jgi:hypothetical protein
MSSGTRPTWRYTVGKLSTARFADVADALSTPSLSRSVVSPARSSRSSSVASTSAPSCVPHLLGLLTTVYCAETGARPPVGATREGVVGFGLAVAEQVVTRARPLFERCGATSLRAWALGVHLVVVVRRWADGPAIPGARP